MHAGRAWLLAVLFSGEERPAPLGVTGMYGAWLWQAKVGSVRGLCKRGVRRRPWAEGDRNRYPEQAGKHAEDWEGGHPRGLDVFHRTFTRPGDGGSLPSPTC